MTLIGHRARNHPQQTAANGPDDDVDDRRTPPDLLAECAELAGVDRFDLDVAANDENTKASAWYDLRDDGLNDGLTGPWWGRVWCNPPYSNVRPWVAKAHAEWSADRPNHANAVDSVAMLLPANRTEQAWWQELIEPGRRDGTLVVYFIAGRRRFDRPGWTKPAKGDRPPFGLCLVVWR